MMRKNGWTMLALAVGLLVAAGVPFLTVPAAQADPGYRHGSGHHEGCRPDCRHHGECEGCPGCGCECAPPCGAGQAVPPCMQDNAAPVPGGMHRRMHDGGGPPPMRKSMGKHLEEMRGMIAKLRTIEAKMESLKSKDGEAFRAASLEHSKLLTDLQASHLKHMEGMMGGK